MTEEAAKSEDRPTPELLEDQVRAQISCDSRVATNTGQQNRQHNSAAVCFSQGQRKGRRISGPDVTLGLCVVPSFQEF